VKKNVKTSLTERELQIARLVLASKSTGDIAQILDIAEGTVGAHLSRVYAFFGVASRVAFLTHVYATPQVRLTLISAEVAMTDAVTPAALRLPSGIALVAERNAPDLTIRLGDSASYAYPLCLELLNASMDRQVPQIVRDGPVIWAGFLQGDLRFVVDRVTQITPPVMSGDADSGATLINHGLNIATTRMTAWLYALRAAALAICGSEKQHTDAMAAAEAAGALVASSQLLPWTMRVTRVFVYACSTKSVAGLDRLLQLAGEIDSLNPVRIYVLTLAVRLAHYLGPDARGQHRTAMELFVAETGEMRQQIQRQASNTVFNVKSEFLTQSLGAGARKSRDGRYAHQCLPDDAELDLYLALESQILRDSLDYTSVTAEYPEYRAKLKLAHAKLRERRESA
jgi:DNA-binding CsgD family transcriptional regulator